jgi:hypothetical protein
VLTLAFDVLTMAFLGFFLLTVGPRLIHILNSERRTH